MEFTLDFNSDKVYDVVIIGAGPAGSSAAIYTARAGLSTLVLFRAEADGALGVTQQIENYPGIRGPISGYELLKLIRDHAKAFGAEFVRGKVIATDLLGEVKKLYTIDGREFKGRAVIVASGAMERTNKYKGEEELLGRGISYCGVCDAAFFKGRPVAVVGEDDYALEETEFIARFASKIYLVVPSSRIKAPHEMVSEIESNPKVEVLLHHRVLEVAGNSVVEGLWVQSVSTKEKKLLPVDGVFIFLGGNKPSVDFLMNQVEMTDEHCIVVNEEMMTSVPGVFACGDVLCNNIKQAVIAAADGVKAALAVDKYLNKKAKITAQW
ncbi:MAG: FAD-dependent oxidoreductase [Aquificaceae bacterium]|nr:FAD-dependent oxidoreductase [Aquificaceae bacterium]MCX8060742.1 FAD-dependent oxidoreductase [Aquificaceae bacterium]MDW8097470.1 FAD-dependent oxidoreductase [Aquificaceae bacterium]